MIRIHVRRVYEKDNNNLMFKLADDREEEWKIEKAQEHGKTMYELLGVPSGETAEAIPME